MIPEYLIILGIGCGVAIGINLLSLFLTGKSYPELVVDKIMR